MDASENVRTKLPAEEPAKKQIRAARPNYLTLMHRQGNLTGLTPSSSVPTLSNPDPPKNSSPYLSRESSLHGDSNSSITSSLPKTLEQSIFQGGKILDISKPAQGLQFTREDEEIISIKPFGALIVLCQTIDDLTVQAVSSNSKEIVGYTPDELLEMEGICNLFSASRQHSFFSHIGTVLDDDYDVSSFGPEVFDLSISSSEGDKRLWCTMHTSRMYKDYIICEFEPQVAYCSGASAFHNTGESQSPATSTDLVDNLSNFDMQLLNDLPRILRQISNSQTLEDLVHHTIDATQRLTNFQRVAMYRFDGERNGIVVADAVDSSLGLKSFEGARFDESTFSKEMKTRYLRNKVCLSYHPDTRDAGLLYRASTNKLGLDISHCYLPAAPLVSEQSAGTSVQACMSISILVFGKLWGLITCQSFDQKLRLHPMLQKAFWMISTTVSSNIERLSYTLPFQLHAHTPFGNTIPSKQHLIGPYGDLLSLFGADYAAASVLGESKILGKPIDSQEMLVLFEYLRAKQIYTVLWSTDIHSDFKDLDYSPGFHDLSGLLYIPLSAEGDDFIVFFRNEAQMKQDATDSRSLPHSLNDLKMTDERTQWTAAEFGKASMLSLLYRTFTEIWQEKEAAMQNNQLMRLLLANSAHEFRTPLNAIINYLEIALDGNLNQETRENLSRSHSASKSLVYIINDLLDLTNAENGRQLIKDEAFSLSDTLCEATDIFWEEARQKHVDLQVVQHSALPPVLGDQRRVRQVITNLISNALQHTSSGAVTAESCILSESCKPGHIAVEIAIHDTGSGMSSEAVETLFCELEQVSNKGYMQSPKHHARDTNSNPETKSVLGLGLALVARIVRNMNGQLSLKSEEEKGSCFKIRLRFPLPSEEPDDDSSLLDDKKQVRSDSEERNIQHTHDTPHKNDQSTCRGHKDSEITQSETKSERPDHVCRCPAGRKSDMINTEDREDSASQLCVLVAEDDPINSTILKKRLEKFGYSVRMTTNGRECASVYRDYPQTFDAVLMDLQVWTSLCSIYNTDFFHRCPSSTAWARPR